jgi:hypothetical protein
MIEVITMIVINHSNRMNHKNHSSDKGLYENFVSLISQNKTDLISLTDMVKGKEGEDHIRNWMRNRNTLEFLGTWELMHNPAFKGVEFDTFLHEAGANRFNMTLRKWIEDTNATGIVL